MLSLLALSLTLTSVLSWGAVGHNLTVSIGTQFFTSNTLFMTNKILVSNQDGPTLQAVSSWADKMAWTEGWEWSFPLHFIDTPDWSCHYNQKIDCSENRCVAGAIVNYTSQLENPSVIGLQQDQALKFTTHFIGDIHQPLHVSFKSNLGGNTINVTFFDIETELHAVWDTYIIQRRMVNDFNNSFDLYTQHLIAIAQTYSAPDICFTTSLEACVQEWADESAYLSCSNAYRNPDGSVVVNGELLTDAYYNVNLPIIEVRLALAGKRMAQVFQYIWG